MSRMPTDKQRLVGRAAVSGIASGRIHVGTGAPAASARRAAADLPEALSIALGELRQLQTKSTPEAADILQFQIELLEDPELTAAAFVAIEAGAAAATAFDAAMAEHLRVYDGASDEYLRERASDVGDLRDRVLRVLHGAPTAMAFAPKEDCLLLLDELTPSGFLELDWLHIKGVATRRGSPTSHVAMLARAQGIPLIVGLQGIEPRLHGREGLLDGDAGCLLLEPDAGTLAAYRIRSADGAERLRKDRESAGFPAATRNGDAVGIYLNVDRIEVLAKSPASWFDGIGLARTELLLDSSRGMANEQAQVESYRPLFTWCDGRPVTIRLLDAGGDKPVPGVTLTGESNPFLGVRGVRLLLRQRELLRTQLRAIALAAEGRPTRILVPMVTIPDELASVRAELNGVLAELSAGPGAFQLGIMVETPAAALTIERFGDADFFSIGTNDLLQYVAASSRDCSELDHLLCPATAPMLELVRRVAAHGRRTGREVSVCGDAAFAPDGVAALLNAGVRALSIPGSHAPAVKSMIRSWTPENEQGPSGA
jgi:phosphotransferase system enzyme I (PtsI)